MPNPSFRITIPRNGEELISLAELNIAKHEDDGLNSPLTVLQMAEMKSQTILARTKDNLSKSLSRDKELAIQQRDNALGENASPGTVDFYLKSGRDLLLGIYKEDEKALGNWGYLVSINNGKVKVTIPVSAKGMIILAGLVIAKHVADGVNSPLKSLDMADFTDKYELANEKNELANQLNRDKEDAIKKRDQLCGLRANAKISKKATIIYYVTQVRDVLLGIYKRSESDLGAWGFDVQYGATPKPVVASMRGTIKNILGEPIQNAQIKVVELNITVFSGSDGKYTVPKQVAGSYTIEISKTDFITQTFNSIPFADNQVFNLDVQLISITGSLIVYVYTEGQPMENAIVQILELGIQQTTTVEGFVTFNSLVPAAYNVTATAAGKEPQTQPVVIEANSTASISFNLVNS